MGEVNVKVTAEGAEPFDAGKRFIGNKGGAYQKRLKAFKDSVQGDYDKEVAEIREFITTLKNLQVEASRHVAQYKKDGGVASLKNKLKVEWDTFSKGAQPLLSQMDTNLKAKQAPDKQAKYHGRAFQDVSTSLAQLDQLIKAQGEKISGGTTTTNVDELDGLLQAGVQALEVWLAQAVSKTPFDSAPSDPGKAPQGASPAPAAGNAPAASSATPVPSGQAPAPAPAAAAASAPTLTPTPTAAPAPAPTPAPAAPSAVPAPSGGAEK